MVPLFGPGYSPCPIELTKELPDKGGMLLAANSYIDSFQMASIGSMVLGLWVDGLECLE